MMQFKLTFLRRSLKGESVRLQPTALDQQWQHEAWGCDQILLCGCYGIAQEDRDSDSDADEPCLKDIQMFQICVLFCFFSNFFGTSHESAFIGRAYVWIGALNLERGCCVMTRLNRIWDADMSFSNELPHHCFENTTILQHITHGVTTKKAPVHESAHSMLYR